MSKRSHSTMSNGHNRPPRMNVLSSILNSASETNRSALSMQTTLHSTPSSGSQGNSRGPMMDIKYSQSPDVVIAEYLQEMRDTIETQGFGGLIEVEVRVGTIASQLHDARFTPSQQGIDAAIVLRDEDMKSHNAKFISGVQKSHFDKYSRVAMRMTEKENSGFTKKEEKQTVYSFPGSKRVIEEVDIETNVRKSPYLQIKKRLGCINVYLPQCPYDIRVSIACEFPNEPLSNGLNSMTTSPEKERHKNRVSAVGKEYRVDLTEVDDGVNGKKLYEVEIELVNEAIQNWLRLTDDANGYKRACENASHVWNVIKCFMPSAGQAFRRSWDFSGGNDIKDFVSRLVSHKWNTDKFPGTMPVGFARRHISSVKSKEYWCSEKTDGVRYFLVVAGGSATLIDRTNSAFTTPGLEMLSTVLPEGTALDGEFVLHQKEQKYIFMAFDIMATGIHPSESHMEKPFKERLEILNKFLSDEGPYAQALRGHVHSSSVLGILRKKWIPARHISSVFQHIKRVRFSDNSIARMFADSKRHHITDGVVFCPNTPYVCGSHDGYLKWKWSDLITIDFVATLTDSDRVSLSCGGPRNTDIDLDRLIVLNDKSIQKILYILRKSSLTSSVFEFGFDIENGLWEYKCHRPDKDRANYINTVLGSLMNMAEGISEEELQYRLLGSMNNTNPSEDWSEMTKNMRRKILAPRLPNQHG